MVGMRKPVRVKVLSCLGSQPIWRTFLPRFANAVEMLQLVVDLPMPPFPYTASVSVKGVAPKSALVWGTAQGCLIYFRWADRIIS